MDPDTDLLLQATTSVAAGRTVWSGARRTLCSERKRESSRVPARVYRPSFVSHKKEKSSTGNTFRQNFSLVSLTPIFRDFLVHSSFLISCHTIKINKKHLNMSIPSSYLTNITWEKFVEKHDDFMQNFKTKGKNEKRNKSCLFRQFLLFYRFGALAALLTFGRKL